MRLAATVIEFASQPGTYLLGERFLCFHPDDRMFGFALWGDHDDRTIERLVRILDAQLDHAVGTHVALSDLSRLGSFDVAAYLPLAERLAARADRLARMIERHVVIRPGGAGGILVSGFYEVARPPYPATVVASAAEAAAALADPGVPALLAEVHALIDAAARVSAAAEVRRLLRAATPPPEIADVARALAMSARTLQRRLQDEGTSFRAERAAAQLDRAKQLLITGDHKIAAIASAVGFASAAHFSAAFQKATGVSPRAWRERNRT